MQCTVKDGSDLITVNFKGRFFGFRDSARVSFQRNLASTDFHQKYDFESQTELKTCEKKKNRKTLQFISFDNILFSFTQVVATPQADQ